MAFTSVHCFAAARANAAIVDVTDAAMAAAVAARTDFDAELAILVASALTVGAAR